MKRHVVALCVITLAMGGAALWHVSAAAPAAPVPVAGPYTPIHPAACSGRNERCPPGSHWVCGPEGKRCWCTPC
jgi:hypothetical protein